MYTAQTPQFLLYPKRKNSLAETATVYVRVIFEKKIHEKSMNVTCRYDQWDRENMIIKNAPLQTYQVRKSFEEFKQKLMGAYFMLQQQSVDFTLQDILDLATGHRKPGVRLSWEAAEPGDMATANRKSENIIQLTENYWSQADAIWVDKSRVSTLIHEMSHFNLMGSGWPSYETYDWGDRKGIYGIEKSKKLAESDPRKALFHADTYSFFIMRLYE